MPRLIPILLLALLVGCTKYEFEVTAPEDLVGRVGYKSDTSFARPPLEYRLQAAENRLVMIIDNRLITTNE